MYVYTKRLEYMRKCFIFVINLLFCCLFLPSFILQFAKQFTVEKVNGNPSEQKD